MSWPDLHPHRARQPLAPNTGLALTAPGVIELPVAARLLATAAWLILVPGRSEQCLAEIVARIHVRDE